MKKGVISLLLLGLVAVLLLLGLTVFGPWELPGFGQLSQRQEQQKSLAAEGLWPPPGDTDQDGFTDKIEEWIHTDSADNCADDANDSAWPPDINNDKKVDQTDADAFTPHFATKLGNKNYDKRFDLNADKKINLLDTDLLRPYFNKGCPFYFLKVDPSIEIAKFDWTPGVQEKWFYIKSNDMTKTGRTTCDLETIKAFGTNIVAAIEIGRNSYEWKVGGFGPLAGHKYCVAIEKDGSTRSPYLEFTMGLYQLTASPSIGKVVFNWNPAVETYTGGGSIPVNDMTVSGRTTCDQGTIETFLGSGNAGGLDSTMTSLTWDISGGGPKAGHKYCAVIRTTSYSSNFVEFTVPSETPTPSLLPSPSPTMSPAPYGWLTVNSIGASAVPISGTQQGTSGTTSYTIYLNSASDQINTTLTAPANWGNWVFSTWNGCNSTSGTNCTVSVKTGEAKSVGAVYYNSSPSPSP